MRYNGNNDLYCIYCNRSITWRKDKEKKKKTNIYICRDVSEKVTNSRSYDLMSHRVVELLEDVRGIKNCDLVLR
jgi:hypothetical protein